MAIKHIIDLSQTISTDSPSPQEPGVEFRIVVDHGPSSLYRMMWMGMSDHVGTHIDAPLHFIPGGASIDEADLSDLISMPGVFLDFTPCSPFQEIGIEDVKKKLRPYETIPEKAFIMLHTGSDWYNTPGEYFNAPWLTPDAAELLIGLRPAAIGVNGPTVDDRRSPGRPIHTAFLSKGIYIIEGIVRSGQLAGRNFRCTALPLKLQGFTGSPIRLVACTD